MDIVSDRYLSNDYLAHNPTWDMEDSPWKATFVADLLQQSINPSSICEVGCGAGGVLANLRKHFPDADMFGFDIAPDAEQFWQDHQDKNIQFTVGDFFTESAQHYDAVLLLDVLEHLQNPFEFLQHIKQHADYFVFHFPLDLSALSVLREKPLLNVRRKVGHIHSFTKNLALELLTENGFEVLKYQYSHAAFSAPQRSWKTKLLSLPRRIAYAVNKDMGVRLLGGETLWILAKS